MDRVPVSERIAQTLENDDARAGTTACATRVRVKWPAVAVRGQYHPLLKYIARPLRKRNRDAASQRHVALAGVQRLARDATATSDVEQAVWIVRLGPRKSNSYDTRVQRKSLSFPSII